MFWGINVKLIPPRLLDTNSRLRLSSLLMQFLNLSSMHPIQGMQRRKAFFFPLIFVMDELRDCKIVFEIMIFSDN